MGFQEKGIATLHLELIANFTDVWVKKVELGRYSAGGDSLHNFLF
jgi:hypothetical protein